MDKYINLFSEQYFAFNIWSIESAKAIMDAASKLHHNIILQTSMAAFESLDKEELRAYVTSYMKKKGIHTYLHLDHCKRMDFIQEAIRCGWDSVMIDASEEPLEDNIRLTNEVCAIAKDGHVLVEAEIGKIGGTEDGISVAEANIAKMEDVEKFVQSTTVDMLAVAIGTSHGCYQGIPKLHYDLIDKTALVSDIPMVVHGGTGLTDEMLLRLLSYKNIKKINFSTDVKLAYRQGIESSIQGGYMDMKGFNPLKVTAMIHDSIENMAMDKMKLLGKERWK